LLHLELPSGAVATRRKSTLLRIGLRGTRLPCWRLSVGFGAVADWVDDEGVLRLFGEADAVVADAAVCSREVSGGISSSLDPRGSAGRYAIRALVCPGRDRMPLELFGCKCRRSYQGNTSPGRLDECCPFGSVRAINELNRHSRVTEMCGVLAPYETTWRGLIRKTVVPDQFHSLYRRFLKGRDSTCENTAGRIKSVECDGGLI
jgi:hypothetical protein